MKRSFCVTLFCLLSILSSCLLFPQVAISSELPTPTYVIPINSVATEYLQLPSYTEPNTPQEYNKTLYLRFYSETDAPKVVFIFMPGIFSGATSINPLARQLVATMPELEVWAVDRRSNLLEDRSTILQSLYSQDPQIAYDYYVSNVDKVDGFNPIVPEEVDFMRNWGLEVHLQDLDYIVQQARELANVVILGGYSIGASIVSYYAAYNFGTEELPDAGYQHIDGLVLLEGSLGQTGGFSQSGGLSLGPIKLFPDSSEIETGKADPFLTFGFGPEELAEEEVVAIMAHFEPDQLSPSKSYDFPITNRAVAGISFDSEYALVPKFSATLGNAVGAKLKGNFAFLLSGLEGIDSRSVVGVSNGHSFVDWEGGNPEQEVTDLFTFISSYTLIETGFNEWYFPLKLFADVVELDTFLEDTPNFVPNRTVDVPTLAIGAELGFVRSMDDFSAYSNVRAESFFSTYILPQYRHFDTLAARENLVVPLFKLWLEQLD